MRDEPQTFPTLRSWRRMSGRQQDALLDKLEARRRWHRLRFRAALAALGLAAAVAVGATALSILH